jgi:hypothetical protein
MQHRRPNPETEVLTEPVAARLLERASQLDAARFGSTAVADLRAAATAAGISSSAFDAALEELQRPTPPTLAEAPAPQPRRRRWKLLASLVAVIVAMGVVGVSRAVAPAGGGLAQEAFVLRCLSAEEAGALIRPILGDNGRALAGANAPRVLNVWATPAQMERVRAELDRQDGPGSPFCAVRPGSAPTR